MGLRPGHDASVVVIRDNQRILLVRRCDVPVWVLPGGGIDPGETPEVAAVREAKEETGLEVSLVRKVAEYEPYRFFTRLTHLFEAQVDSGELSLNDEASEVSWFPEDALPKDLLSIHKIWIRETLEGRNTLIRRPQKEVTLWRVLQIFFANPRSSLVYFLKRIFGR